MMNTSVLNFPTRRSKTITLPPSSKLADVKAPSTSVEKTEQLLALCENDYQWHYERNQQEAQEYLQGAQIACQHGLASQIRLYKEHLIRIVTKDMAERTRSMANSGGNALDFMYYHSDHQLMPTTSFAVSVPSNSWDTQRYQWVYVKLNAFDRMIPPAALAMFDRLENESITPQAYWVADKVEIVRHKSVDPVLCAQYGRWFVGIAHWY